MFFKGYVPTKNKRCLKTFKNKTSSELDTYDQVKELQEYAGILNNEIILIDIDDAETSEILLQIVKDKKLKCRVYQTTRGKHFLFKNKDVKTNRTKANLAIGIEADIKLGSRNSNINWYR